MEKRIKAVMSYSGGKDGALALYRAVKSGYDPIALLTTFNDNAGRSWFHGIPVEVLTAVSEAMGIPLKLVRSEGGDEYATNFESALLQLRTQGAEVCIFGDIDIQGHYDWCAERCEATGLDCLFPLWNENRRDLVYELIDSGFKTVLTIVDTTRLDIRFLGKTLTKELADEIAAEGADICGENGEYHSFVYDGPLFKKPLDFKLGDTLMSGNLAIAPLVYA